MKWELKETCTCGCEREVSGLDQRWEDLEEINGFSNIEKSGRKPRVRENISPIPAAVNNVPPHFSKISS